jgi:hypothetical protein
MIDTVLSILYWFARPSIAAWAGAIATLAALFLAEPRRHMRRPLRFLRKAPRIVIVWLVIAWILSQLAGPGRGGAGTGGGRGETQGPGQASHAGGGNADLVLRLRFLPRDNEPKEAKDFICVLRTEWTDGAAQEKTVTGKDLIDFELNLRVALQQLRDRPGRVIIERIPYPGEGVLRRIRITLQQVWPDQLYEEVEP